MNARFDVGDRPRTTWTVKLNGAVTDPPVVILVVQNPSGEQVSIYGELSQPYTIFKQSTGVYYADIPLTVAGQWRRRWLAYDEEGDPLDAFESPFRVGTDFAQPLPPGP